MAVMKPVVKISPVQEYRELHTSLYYGPERGEAASKIIDFCKNPKNIPQVTNWLSSDWQDHAISVILLSLMTELKTIKPGDRNAAKVMGRLKEQFRIEKDSDVKLAMRQLIDRLSKRK